VQSNLFTDTERPPITVITGEMSAGAMRNKWLARLGWGRCYVIEKAPPRMLEPWCFDNGAFRWFKDGRSFDEATYQGRLNRWDAIQQQPGTFAVLPDIVCAGLDSLDYSLAWIAKDNEATEYELPWHWSWFLAVQDGMSLDAVEAILRDQTAPDWQDRYQVKVAGLFIGGSVPFKHETAGRWVDLAHRYGLKCHYGRASGLGGLRRAIVAGCDSCDTAAILWKDRKFFRYAQVWLEESVGLDRADPDLVTWVAEHVAETIARDKAAA